MQPGKHPLNHVAVIAVIAVVVVVAVAVALLQLFAAALADAAINVVVF